MRNINQENQSKSFLVTIIVVVAVAVIAYIVLNAPDRRTPGEKVSDSANELSNGVDKAARQLEDRTPAEKIGDAAKDAGDDIKHSTDR